MSSNTRLLEPDALRGAWISLDYVAGFAARQAGDAEVVPGKLYWRLGWQDADMELRETTRCLKVEAEGGRYDFPILWAVLNGAGTEARVHGIPFNEARTSPWKEGWIEADVNWEMMIRQRER